MLVKASTPDPPFGLLAWFDSLTGWILTSTAEAKLQLQGRGNGKFGIGCLLACFPVRCLFFSQQFFYFFLLYSDVFIKHHASEAGFCSALTPTQSKMVLFTG